MSEIFGFSLNKKNEKNSNLYLNRLKVWNAHYGHNGSDSMLTKSSGLGCNLKNISDNIIVSKPIIKKQNKLYAIDAMLFNKKELLKKAQVVDDNISDEELLVELIIKFGYDVLAEINGDFAGACYEKDCWTLFRDHMGIRPLYYYNDGKTFIFSSDIRAFYALPDIDLSLNNKFLYLMFMGYSTLSSTETELFYVSCVKPTSILSISKKNNSWEATERIYWEPAKKKIRYKNSIDYVSKMNELIIDAIDIRARIAPKNIGAELSGGLDSGVISILLNRLGYNCKYVSWSQPYDEIPAKTIDERKVIDDICNQENILCKFLPYKKINPEFYTTNMFPAFANSVSISRTSKELSNNGVKIIFSGQGGDELVSHRCSLYELWYNHEWLACWQEMLYLADGKSFKYLRAIKYLLNNIKHSREKFLHPWRNMNFSLEDYLNKDFLNKMINVIPSKLYFAFNPKQHILNGGERSRLDNVAFQSAKYNTRYLFPFLDYRIVDFSLSIPRNLYLKKGIDRWIYRQAFKNIMPNSLREVDYKDIPSRSEITVSAKVLLKYSKYIIDKLDFNRYSNLIDKDSITKFLLTNRDELSDDLKSKQSQARFVLIYLLSIQNLKDNAAKWADDHLQD